MGFINVFVSSNCSINIQHNSLHLVGDSTASYPLEDINAVMVEGHCTITSHTLSALAEHGALLYTCNSRHMPCAVTLPTNAYYKRLSMLQSQLDMSLPRTKQLWQYIVRAKITNQALCLDYHGIDSSSVSQLLSTVSSGDSANVEATAAVRYFQLLRGSGYTRHTPCLFNSAIDYTYAIVRSMIARGIVAHGMESSLGIHHHNAYNGYNLADDLIEPYRGIVDCYVASVVGEHTDMSTAMRYQLFGITNVDVSIDGQHHPLSRSIEMYITSYLRAMSQGAQHITPPTLIGVATHSYE